MKDQFDTEEKQESAVNDFRNLMRHAGWKQFVTVLDIRIEIIKDQILTGRDGSGKDLTEEFTARLRDELKVHEVIKGTPEKFIKDYSKTETDETLVDPYETMEQMKADRKKK